MAHTKPHPADITGSDLILAGQNLLIAVRSLRRAARAFCVHELGIDWASRSMDRYYFAAKMRECRRSQKALRERVRGSIPRRGKAIDPLVVLDRHTPEVIQLLLSSNAPIQTTLGQARPSHGHAALSEVESHLRQHLTMEPTDIRALPSVDAHPRIDIALKLMAALFLHQRHLIRIEQGERTVFLAARTSPASAT